ncbi:DNA repair protein RecN [Paenibacillus urinalis]|uniref:DNA repair protein RecN n=2 Tax=Paenibacillus TaxID=44249 RepID=A0AAX3MY60_9BACL|nr:MULTISPECIES: DNA repair protein RecN [Paenibacillus]OMC68758.1 DNA repair protein RecN [Paenibacillus sp. FSL H7-0326]WDH81314.1 DNA repair protein RecN [Paenibacillus urinalis]WDH97365.1 DNA repair protein RecN [Paenibacillus urinalis]WDI01029.1 DNA repair protein RecN [Paenibacillus urinalis]SDW52607.1 DNA replication and repair protein RecN [Paenibacillus sp. PDC88]
MLSTLSIRNLAVIEAVDVHFHSGFHVLTGETGAGKSIIIDALGLIAGGRGSADLIRYGCDKAEMEALFELSAHHPVWNTLTELGIQAEPDEHLVIRRELTVSGKSVSRINGQLVNLTMLREIGEQLINIHGQHEHQSLLRAEKHLGLLDTYGETIIRPIKIKYSEQYRAFVKVEKELRQLQESSQKAYQMLDMYRFQLEEIAAASLVPGEDESLAEERVKLSHSEKMMDSVSGAYELLHGSQGLEAVSYAISKLEDINEYDHKGIHPILEQLQSAFYQLEDAAFQLRSYRDGIEFNPVRLSEVEERLNMITGLKRKYGESVESILQYYVQIERETDHLENKDERLEKLLAERNQLLEGLLETAEEMSEARKICAEELSNQVERELKDLQMERTTMRAQISIMEDPKGVEWKGKRIRITKHGIDNVEFLISANPGEPLRPLGKIASGGEMSRIMLALKSIFARHDQIPVLIFDEVDTGVSGRAAQSIAEKLFILSSTCQVFSITHLPQVACMADHQYLIEKNVHDERTMTQVESLSEQGRVTELARMLGGVEITEKTLHHAQEMLKLAEAKKGA